MDFFQWPAKWLGSGPLGKLKCEAKPPRIETPRATIMLVGKISTGLLLGMGPSFLFVEFFAEPPLNGSPPPQQQALRAGTSFRGGGGRGGLSTVSTPIWPEGLRSVRHPSLPSKSKDSMALFHVDTAAEPPRLQTKLYF